MSNEDSAIARLSFLFDNFYSNYCYQFSNAMAVIARHAHRRQFPKEVWLKDMFLGLSTCLQDLELYKDFYPGLRPVVDLRPMHSGVAVPYPPGDLPSELFEISEATPMRDLSEMDDHIAVRTYEDMEYAIWG
jgi:hypothetical protein